MKAIRYLVAMPVLASLAACGVNENDPGPGGVTVGEAKRLDDAAEMLEERDRSPADDNAERADQLRREMQDTVPKDNASE